LQEYGVSIHLPVYDLSFWSNSMVHTLAPLPYTYDALEPYIDAKTMEIHYSKHHQTYVDKLNAAVAGTEWEETGLDELLQSVVLLPKDKQTAVKNHGGGHRNHTFFWASMTAGGKTMPTNLGQAISKQFGSVDAFKEQFAQSALNNF
jgi:Fe-Mn family superoxide dismutase